MTISVTTTSVSYTGNGSLAGPYSIPFWFGPATDLAVTVAGATVTAFTVSATSTDTATLTFTTAPANAAAIVITRVTPATQSLDLTRGGDFDPTLYESALDRLTRIDQELRAVVASLAAVNVPSYTTAAAASAASAAASYDSFDDRYLGAKAANPTLDNDGNALLTGALYWNTAANEMRAYSGSAWVVTYNPSVSAVSSFGVGARTGSVVLTASDLATSVFGPFTALASAATTDLSTITTVGASITGTTTITAFAGNNLLRVVKFAGILTLTYNATTLILPGAASITTAAGDTAIVLTDASGNATVVTYTRAANAPLTYATAAEYRANTANRILTTDKVWTAADIVTLTDAATITPDFSTGFDFTVTLGGNRTIANPTNTKNGQGGVLYVKQDATGSRTASWGTNWKWSSGTAPTLTTTASRTDKIFYKVESATIIHASIERDSR